MQNTRARLAVPRYYCKPQVSIYHLPLRGFFVVWNFPLFFAVRDDGELTDFSPRGFIIELSCLLLPLPRVRWEIENM